MVSTHSHYQKIPPKYFFIVTNVICHSLVGRFFLQLQPGPALFGLECQENYLISKVSGSVE